ncbi:hypothetical protein CMI47_19955 [Candidatus Pacearchaeota archaeon]|nr:hypothetical protein [Candidatus Pacearchaeota archaeon]|tara:strand:- start:342 stop:2240 length:1899 start_codon:yes stop_codon:yes gene_type:complete
MLTTMFENRNKYLSQLIKLGDCLGRSLRENVELFSVDSLNSNVTYVTESGQVVKGVYELDEDITLNDIEILPTKTFEDGDRFDSLVSEKVASFIDHLHVNEYSAANTSFSDVLNLWEDRLKLDRVKAQLQEKTAKFSGNIAILETDEFKKFIEIFSQVQSFLSENAKKISKVTEVTNGFKLSNTISQAFDFPKLSYDDLMESRSYTVRGGTNDSIYEIICQQELAKKELLEAKNRFASAWANNEKVRTLAGLLYEKEEVIQTALAEAVLEVPYLALVSKGDLKETLSNSLKLGGSKKISEQDIVKYAAKLFELKKPVKKGLLAVLNEKYGINIQNLQDPPSFKSLANTQVVIFETLSRLAPKASVMKQVLSEVASMLKSKSGVECIDVNTYLYELFSGAGYTDILLSEARMASNIDFDKVADDLGEIGDVLRTIKQNVGDEEQYASDETLDQEDGEEDFEGDEEEFGGDQGDLGDDNDDAGTPDMAPEDVPLEDEVPEGEEELPPEEEEEEEEMDEPAPREVETSSEDLMANIKDLEGLLADLSAELGVGEEEAGLEPEEGDEFEGEEEEEGFPGEEEEEEDEEDDMREEGKDIPTAGKHYSVRGDDDEEAKKKKKRDELAKDVASDTKKGK